MHAREITLRAREGRFDRLVELVRGRVLPADRQQPGYVAFALVVEREECRVVSTTWWETEADMLAGEEGGYLDEQLGILSPLLSEPPAIRCYDASPLR